jgi:hypothetical protein
VCDSFESMFFFSQMNQKSKSMIQISICSSKIKMNFSFFLDKAHNLQEKLETSQQTMSCLVVLTLQEHILVSSGITIDIVYYKPDSN